VGCDGEEGTTLSPRLKLRSNLWIRRFSHATAKGVAKQESFVNNGLPLKEAAARIGHGLARMGEKLGSVRMVSSPLASSSDDTLGLIVKFRS
jgi:hypothetical protein